MFRKIVKHYTFVSTKLIDFGSILIKFTLIKALNPKGQTSNFCRKIQTCDFQVEYPFIVEKRKSKKYTSFVKKSKVVYPKQAERGRGEFALFFLKNIFSLKLTVRILREAHSVHNF